MELAIFLYNLIYAKYSGVQLFRTMEIGKKTVRISGTMYVKLFDKIMDF